MTAAANTNEIAAARERIDEVRREVGRVYVGSSRPVDTIMVALLARGHALLEGVPGVAKTTLVKAFATALGCSARRIQFTPDLLPADITGTYVLSPRDGTFTLRAGPIFANVVLADEINRAPAKTQSALLEAMQERQVTLGENTYILPEPFLVMATQNPVEQEGTYPLPEAQVDRFMLKIVVNYPSRTEERSILDTMATTSPNLSVQPVVTPEDILRARQVVNLIHVDDKVRDYIVDVVIATRDPKAYKLDFPGWIQYGASPRATIAMTLAARALAFLNGRAYVTPQDVKEVAHDVLQHRVTVTYEAEAENLSSRDIVQKILDTLPVP